MGLIAAVLKVTETVPDRMERGVMAEIRGTREGRQVFTRAVGRGSS